MNLEELKKTLEACNVLEVTPSLESPGGGPESEAKRWLELFSLRNRGFLNALAQALKGKKGKRQEDETPDLLALHRLLGSRYPSESEFGRTVRLYSGVAAALQAMKGHALIAGLPGVSMEDLVLQFGAGPVADVKAELEGTAGSERTYPDLYDDELKRADGDPLWPWKDPKRTFQSVMVPVVAVKSVKVEDRTERVGVAGWFRFDWVNREEAIGAAHVYLAPAQMAVRRTALPNPPSCDKETSWWEAELAILDYLAGQVGNGPVAPSRNALPEPYTLPLRPSNGRRLGGDIRWWMMMEGGENASRWGGDSFGLAYVFGMVQVLAKLGVDLPSKWERLGKEELMSGVLGMAAVDRDGSLRPVGLTYEKLKASIPSFIRYGGRTIHTVVAARKQETELKAFFGLDSEGWLGKEREKEKEMRFLFAETADEAITKVLEHLGSMGVVDRAIRRYGEAQEALWRREFREPGPLNTSHLPPYVESQGLRMLDARAMVPAALTADAFAMSREGNHTGSSARSASEWWQPKDREQLLQELSAFAARTERDGSWTAPPQAPGNSVRLLAVTHDAGQGKTALLQWLEHKLRNRLPSGYWVVKTGVEQVGQPVEKVLVELAIKLGLPSDDQKIQEELRSRLSTGRILFLVDGLDHVGKDVRTDWLASLINTIGKHCRWVVAGRPHALSLHWEGLFEATEAPWRFLLLDYFAEADQEAYLGETLFQRVTTTIEVPKDLLAVPRALYYVRQLAGESPVELEKIQTPSDVYLHAVKNMVTEGFKAVASQGIGDDEAMRLLSAMAFEMVLARKFDAVEAGEMDDFLREVAQRYVRAKRPARAASLEEYDEDWLRGSRAAPGPLRQLAAMNEGLNCGLLERGCPDRIQWRNRSLQEFFAGYWLANYCLKEDQKLLRGMLYLDEEKETYDYQWMWRFVAEMPEKESSSERWVWALRPLYLPDDFPAPQGSPERKRSTELIWRTWKRMEQDGPEVIKAFHMGFRQLVGRWWYTRRGWTARRLTRSFVRCPKHPEDDKQPFPMGSPTSEAGRKDDEILHMVQVSPFWMGRHVVTQEEFGLFEPVKPRDRWQGREPEVHICYCDAWVFAKWAGCRLPTEAEWEYACRAGTTTEYCFVGDPTRPWARFPRNWFYDGRFLHLGSTWYGWLVRTWYGRLWKFLRYYGLLYPEDGGIGRNPVGQRQANAWGLHDMRGEVWEWCEDWYGPYEVGDGEMVKNPTGPNSGTFRVLRGDWSRSAARYKERPDDPSPYIGFRLVLVPA